MIALACVHLIHFPEPPDFNDPLILRQGCNVEHVVSCYMYIYICMVYIHLYGIDVSVLHAMDNTSVCLFSSKNTPLSLYMSSLYISTGPVFFLLSAVSCST